MADSSSSQVRGSSPSMRTDEVFGSGSKQKTPSSASQPKTTNASSGANNSLQLPPPVMQILSTVEEQGRKFEAARSRSRFNVVRQSRAFRAVSWSNPFLSGAVLAAATTLYLSFYSFNSTLLGLASTLVVIALGLSGLETLYNNHNVAQQLPVQGLPAKLPTLALPVNSGSIEGLFAAMGAAVVSFLEMLNGHLTWQSPSESIKALGYAWLVMRFAALLTPGWLLFYALLSFVVAPLYLLNQPMVDSAFTTQVLPQLKKVAHTITSTQTAALHWLKTNQPVALIGGAVSGALLLYFAWGAVSFSGLFTTAALTRATLDAVLALADTTSSATGASRND